MPKELEKTSVYVIFCDAHVKEGIAIPLHQVK